MSLQQIITEAEEKYDLAYEEFCELDELEGEDKMRTLDRRHELRSLMTLCQKRKHEAQKHADSLAFLEADALKAGTNVILNVRKAEICVFIAECMNESPEVIKELRRVVRIAEEDHHAYFHAEFKKYEANRKKEKAERDAKKSPLDGQRAFLKEHLAEIPDNIDEMGAIELDILTMQVYKEFILDCGVEPEVHFDHRVFNVDPEDPSSMAEYAEAYHTPSMQYHNLKNPPKANPIPDVNPCDVKVCVIFEFTNGENVATDTLVCEEDLRILIAILGSRSVGKRRKDLCKWCKEHDVPTYKMNVAQLYVQIEDGVVMKLLK